MCRISIYLLELVTVSNPPPPSYPLPFCAFFSVDSSVIKTIITIFSLQTKHIWFIPIWCMCARFSSRIETLAIKKFFFVILFVLFIGFIYIHFGRFSIFSHVFSLFSFPSIGNVYRQVSFLRYLFRISPTSSYFFFRWFLQPYVGEWIRECVCEMCYAKNNVI